MKYLIPILAIFLSTSLYSQNIFFDYSVFSKEPLKIYHENGQLKEIGILYEGHKFGIWVSYFENGNKKAKVEFDSKGRKDGEWLVWDDNSKLRAKMFYKNGVRKGKWEIYDKHGNILNQKIY